MEKFNNIKLKKILSNYFSNSFVGVRNKMLINKKKKFLSKCQLILQRIFFA